VDKGASQEQQHPRPSESLRYSTGTQTVLVALRRLNDPSYIAQLSLTPFLAAPFPYESFIRLIRSSGFEGVGENKKSISLGDPAANFREHRYGEARGNPLHR
jgi:hypothetical protein